MLAAAVAVVALVLHNDVSEQGLAVLPRLAEFPDTALRKKLPEDLPPEL